MFEALIIAGVIMASAILIYVGLKPGDESQEIRIRRMARTIVRSVEQRAQWDITLNSTTDKWARIVLVLQDEFDVKDEWLHIIIGEAQFDMEADYDSSRQDRHSQQGRTGTNSRLDAGDNQGRSDGIGIDDERSPDDLGDSAGWPRHQSFGGTQHFNNGEDTPIPSAG